MKRLLTIACVLFALAFSPDSKPQRYFLCLAEMSEGAGQFTVFQVVRANWFKEAHEIFEQFVKKNYSRYRRVIYADSKTYSNIVEIDFDKVLTK